MRVLPQSTLSSGTEVIQNAIVVKIMLKEELGGYFGQRRCLVHSLGSHCINRLSEVVTKLLGSIVISHSHAWHRVAVASLLRIFKQPSCERLSHGTISVKIVHGKSGCVIWLESLLRWGVWLEAQLVLIDLIESLIGLARI